MMIRLTRSQFVNYAYVLLAFFIGDELLVESHTPNRKGSYTDQIHSLVWRSFDSLFRVVARIKHLEQGESHLFCIAKHRYLGRPFSVDGVCVRRFDPVIEIHMNNKRLAQVIREQDSVVTLAARLLKEARRSLPALANYVAAQKKYQKVKMLYGVTLIHRGVERFGFSTHPIHSPTTHRFLAWYLRNILLMANPNAYVLSKSHPDIFNPKLVAISKQRLVQEFGGSRVAEMQTEAEGSPC